MKVRHCFGLIVVALAAAGPLPAQIRDVKPPTYGPNYGNDRAEIQDLTSRYFMAFDFDEPEVFASTFAKDGVFTWAGGTAHGREEIANFIRGVRERRIKAKAADQAKGIRAARPQHHFTDMVLKIEGDHATGRTYWYQYWNENPTREPRLRAYGHTEDQYIRVDGRWLTQTRRVYNEILEKIASPGTYPAW